MVINMTFTPGNPTNSPGGDDWLSCAKAAMSVVVSSLAQAPFEDALQAAEDFRGELTAVEALHIAKRQQAGFSDRSTETVMKKSGKVSKGEAKKRTKRGKAVEKNPGLAKKMASGEISTEQIDLIAEASEQTDGEAAEDEKLIDDIAGANPDQGRKIARKYVDDHTDQNDRDDRYARQRKRRKVYKGRNTNGMSSIIIEGDDESVNGMLESLRKRADEMYRRDGGRDVPADQHARSNDQRLFDAAFEQITGRIETGEASAKSDEPARAPANRPGERPLMVFRSDISGLTDDPELLASWITELVGGGTVPSTLASYYRCISDFAVQLVNSEGAVLKQGRKTRRVTPDQWAAMVVRDGGCVQCGAHHTRCEAHHQRPWTSPARGETNIDEMVLLCVDCHHRLHELNQTIYQDPNGKWKVRAATLDETPARGPTKKRKRKAKPESRAASKQRAAKRALAKW